MDLMPAVVIVIFLSIALLYIGNHFHLPGIVSFLESVSLQGHLVLAS